MKFPNDKELKKMREKLEKAEPSRTLLENATKADKVKYKICEKFVLHLLETKKSQAALSRELSIDTARINDIVKYRINLFTIDKLLEFAEKLDPNIELEVA